MVLDRSYDQVIFAEGWDDGAISVILCDAAGIEAKQMGILSSGWVRFVIRGERDNSEIVLRQQVAVAFWKLLFRAIGAVKLVLDA